MKIIKLNGAQFELEKARILAVLLEWKAAYDIDIEKIVTKLDLRNSTWLPEKNSDLLYDWCHSVDNMIKFIIKDSTTYKDKFVFFILVNNDKEKKIEGLAICLGLRKFNHNAQEYFGMKEGTYFMIDDIIISEPQMFSRYLPEHYNEPQKRLGEALLQAIVRHVSMLTIPYPIAAQPHYADERAHKFFKKYYFIFDYGAMGHGCILNIADFAKILEAAPVEKTVGNHFSFLKPLIEKPTENNSISASQQNI